MSDTFKIDCTPQAAKGLHAIAEAIRGTIKENEECVRELKAEFERLNKEIADLEGRITKETMGRLLSELEDYRKAVDALA